MKVKCIFNCLVVLSLSLYVSQALAQQQGREYPKPGLFQVAKKKMGYMNGNGTLVIPMQFTNAFPFSDGLAAVKKDKTSHWGYINTSGQMVGKARYQQAYSFQNGVASAVLPGGSSFVVLLRTKNGYRQSKPVKGRPMHNSEGMVTFRVKRSHLFGVVDAKGSIVLKPSFVYIGEFHEGLAPVVRVRDGKEYGGYIDTRGNIVIPLNYSWPLAFGGGLAPVQKTAKSKWTYINRRGQLAFDGKYDTAFPFSEGLGRVEREMPEGGHVYGYIDDHGNIRVPFKFSNADDFHEGLAAVAVHQGDSMRWGYIDYSGQWVIKPTYSYVGDFHRGLAEAHRSTDKGTVDGWIDRTGHWVQKSVSQTLGEEKGLGVE